MKAMFQVPRDENRELNVVPKRKILFKATIDETQQRIEGREIQHYWG